MYLNKFEIKTHGVWRRVTLEIDFMYEDELKKFIRIAFGEEPYVNNRREKRKDRTHTETTEKEPNVERS